MAKTSRAPAGKIVSSQLRNSLRDSADVTDALRVVDLFAEADIPLWFHGGFALDAFTGTCNTHGDVDSFCRYSDRPRIIEKMQPYIAVIGPYGLIMNVGGAKFEISWIRPWRRGILMSVSHELIWRFGPDAFDHDKRAMLEGRQVPILHPKFIHMELTHPIWRKKRFREKHAARGQMIAEHLTSRELEESRCYWPVRNTFANRMSVMIGIWPKPRPKKRKMEAI